MKEQAKALPTLIESLELLPIGVLVYDLEKMQVVECNRALLKQFNSPNKETFLEEGPFSASPRRPQHYTNLGQLLKNASENPGSTFEIELNLGKEAIYCAEAAVDFIPIDNRQLLLITFKDITERKGVKDQLQESQDTLKAVIKTAVDGIIIIDSRGRIQMANEAAQRLFGYELEELLNQNIKMLMPEPHQSQHDTYLDNYQRTGEEKIIGIGREVSGKRKDGRLFPIRLAVSKVETEHGRLFVGVIHDLTNQKAAEKKILSLNRQLEQKVEERTEKLTEVVNKLLQSNIKLEQEIKEKESAEAALLKNEQELKEALEKEKELNELKSRFVSMASHEFRTPLTTIASSSELLSMYKKTEQQEKREKHLKRIKSAVTNLTGVLGDFLSLSKLEEGKIHSQPVEFTLEELLKEAVEDMYSLLKPEQTIKTNFTKTNQTVILDKKLFKNILINLLSNAIKYSDKGSAIWLNVKLENKLISASLKDEGIGIPEEDQKHLFSRFFRAENAINIQGTGLGLNIVKRYLEILNGSIEFESVQGKGTIFYFKIPV